MKQTKERTTRKAHQNKTSSKQPISDDHSEQDKQLCDLVLHSLYNNAQNSAMSLENEIFKPNNVRLPMHESQRIWNVLLGSGWVVPCVGFGNAGKIGLSKAGYQLMVQFGGYQQFLAFTAGQ